MAERLHITMPVSRPNNLAAILLCYLNHQEKHSLELRIHLGIQGIEPDGKGYKKVEEMIQPIKSGWCWTPSDDSLQPRNLFRILGETISKNPLAKVIVF